MVKGIYDACSQRDASSPALPHFSYLFANTRMAPQKWTAIPLGPAFGLL